MRGRDGRIQQPCLGRQDFVQCQAEEQVEHEAEE
ncbi:hypothetical protein A2U01_0062652, partial [Trifolium medium]|nr:hypothetical protein [Trifolium medium]